MKYNLRTLELFGRPDLLLDPERGAAAVRSAAALGVALPDAVAEWYTVPQQSELWRRWYADIHAPAVWRKAGTNCMVAPSSDDYYREWWVNPPVVRDLSGWIKHPILPLMCEHQGTWTWGVVLDGTADPAAVISYDCDDTWDTCADSFSSYVYAIVFDASLLSPEGIRRDFGLDACVSGEHRRALREGFRPEPTTRGDGSDSGVFIERYSRPGQRFSFSNRREHRLSCWKLWAADAAGFSDLTGRLCQVLPGLSRSVSAREPESGNGEIPF